VNGEWQPARSLGTAINSPQLEYCPIVSPDGAYSSAKEQPVLEPAKNNEQLQPLIGEWSMAIVMPGQERPDKLPDVGARATFEWMCEKAFVLERWTVPIPEAPDGLAVIRWDEGRGNGTFTADGRGSRKVAADRCHDRQRRLRLERLAR
jgi:hypothetical protein